LTGPDLFQGKHRGEEIHVEKNKKNKEQQYQNYREDGTEIIFFTDRGFGLDGIPDFFEVFIFGERIGTLFKELFNRMIQVFFISHTVL
jgi:hypothetical protein